MSVDKNKQMISVSNVEYVKSIIHMMLHTAPGDNIMNPDMGIGIQNFYYTDDSQLNRLSDRIKEQFSTYTDILVTSVDIQYQGNKIVIGLTVSFDNAEYIFATTNTATDIAQILNK